MLFIKDIVSLIVSLVIQAILYAVAVAFGIFLVTFLLLGCGAAIDPVDGDPDAGDLDAGGDSDSDSDSDSDADSDSDVDTDVDTDVDSDSDSDTDSDSALWSPCIRIEAGTTAFCGALCREAGLGDCAVECWSEIDINLHGSETCGADPGMSGSCDTVWTSDGDDDVRCCCEGIGG